MTELEADFLSATVHLLHAASAADAAAGSLFSASKYIHVEKPCIDLIVRINKTVKEIDAIRDDISKLMTHGYKADKEQSE